MEEKEKAEVTELKDILEGGEGEIVGGGGGGGRRGIRGGDGGGVEEVGEMDKEESGSVTW